jgi:hypothetical protein
VFTAENEDVPPELDDVALPGRGANCNLWLARADGSGFYQLTHHETAVMDARGTLHPQFSPDGSELMWADRAGEAEGSFWGHWVVKVADFVDDGIDDPHLENIRTFDPAAQHGFYETHAFSHDGQRVLFTGNLEEGQHETGMDLYEMDVASGERRQLTTTFDDWDEHAHWAPTHDHVVWMSSTDLDVSYPDDMGPLDWRHYLATEMWIMDPDGSNRQRLTFFNDPEHEHHIAARTVVSDSTWAPDGMSLLTLIAFYDDTGPQSEVYIELMHIELQQD